MSKAPSTFKKTNVKRLLEAAAMAGVKVKRFEVGQDGTMSLVIDDGATAPKQQDSDPLDNWMATRADATQGH